MPLYDNHFAGHMPEGDPRSPVHGGAGCTWPTVPAMRYLFLAPSASGVFFPFRFGGALVIRPTIAVDHDNYAYQAVAWPAPWTLVYCRKVADSATGGYRWQIQFHAGSGLCTVTIDKAFPSQKCNVTVPLGDYSCPGGIPLGSTGADFRMEQVEFDDVSPP